MVFIDLDFYHPSRFRLHCILVIHISISSNLTSGHFYTIRSRCFTPHFLAIFDFFLLLYHSVIHANIAFTCGHVVRFPASKPNRDLLSFFYTNTLCSMSSDPNNRITALQPAKEEDILDNASVLTNEEGDWGDPDGRGC
jgi:hypothetical protein